MYCCDCPVLPIEEGSIGEGKPRTNRKDSQSIEKAENISIEITKNALFYAAYSIMSVSYLPID